MSDYGVVVGCMACREALSARLDGEPELSDPTAVDGHLAGCQDCRQWYEDAAAVTRLIRTGPAAEPGPVSETVLAAVPGRGRARVARLLRIVLGVLGVVQLQLGAAQVAVLAFAPEHAHGESILTGATPGHLWHESAAWNVAVGVAFVWIATRLTTTSGFVAVLSAFVGVLTLLNVADLAHSRVEITHLATHAFILTGYLIVLALTRPSLTFDSPPGSPARMRDWWPGRRHAAEQAPSERPVPPGDESAIRRLPAAHGGSGPDRSQRRAA